MPELRIRVAITAILGILGLIGCGGQAPWGGTQARLESGLASAEGWALVTAESPEAEPGLARVVVGVPGGAAVDRLLEVLGAQVRDDKFHILGRVLPLRGARLLATFEDPERPGLPVTLLCAADPVVLGELMPGLLPSSRPQLSLWSGANPVLRVGLTGGGKARQETFVDLAPERVVHPERYLRTEMEGGWRVLVHRDVSAAHVEAYVQSLIQTESRLERWTGAAQVAPGRDVIVEAWASALVTVGQGPQSWALAPPGVGPLLVWLDPGFDDQAGLNDAGARHAEREARRRLGPASADWMSRAAGLEAADAYAGMSLEDWVRGGRGWAGSLDELLNAEASRYSPHEREPAQALLWRVALEADAQGLLRAWRGEADMDWTRHERLWRERMQPRVERGRRELEVRPACIGVLAEAPMAERGGNLGSAEAAARLELVRASGLDCVGLVVHLAPPEEAGQAWRSLEGDAAVVAWLRRARSMGLLTALVLEHWVRPSNIPAGDRVMGTAAEWSAFFESHTQAAVHVACLARMAGVDLLCLGMGQGESLRTRDANGGATSAVMEARAAGWAQVLEGAGGAFTGALTVARNGARQAWEFGSGEDLNACAISLYGDLSSKQQRLPAGERLLEQRARLALDACSQLALDLEQPLVILPLAAAPTSLASRGRLAGPGEGTEAEQLRVLRAWGRALAGLEQGARPPAATFLWRWPALGPGAGAYACSLEGARSLQNARR